MEQEYGFLTASGSPFELTGAVLWFMHNCKPQ
jgi:hypothetical protein